MKIVFTGAYVGGGGLQWVHVHPPTPQPPPEKKVPLRNVQKRKERSAQKNARSAQIKQN